MSRPFWSGGQVPPGTWPYSIQDLLAGLPLRGSPDNIWPWDFPPPAQPSPSPAYPPRGGLLGMLAEEKAPWDPSTSGLLGRPRSPANSDSVGSPTALAEVESARVNLQPIRSPDPAGDWSSSAPHWLQTAMPFGLDIGLSSWGAPQGQTAPLPLDTSPFANLPIAPPGNAEPSSPFFLQTVLPPETNPWPAELSPPFSEGLTDPTQQSPAGAWDRTALPIPSAPSMPFPAMPSGGSWDDAAPSSPQLLVASDSGFPALSGTRDVTSLAARNVLSDEPAARDSKRWISDEIIGPQSQLSDAAAPISEGVPPAEMWPDRPADSDYQLSTRQSIEAQSDRRIVSDITPDNDWMPGARYASKGQPPRRRGGPVQIGDRFVTPSYEQGIRLTTAEARAQDAIARVREFDPSWRPKPSAYESVEGLIRAHEADAQQAQAHLREIARAQFLPRLTGEKPAADPRWSDIARDIARRFVENHRHVVEGTAWLFELEPSIEAYLDPPRSLEELRQAVSDPKKGYDIHHIVEKTSAEQDRFPRSMIHGPENIVRIPRFKHWEITSWYQRQNDRYEGLSPREYLRGKDWNKRLEIGLEALIEHGVLKR
jgi:hypothetical protein